MFVVCVTVIFVLIYLVLFCSDCTACTHGFFVVRLLCLLIVLYLNNFVEERDSSANNTPPISMMPIHSLSLLPPSWYPGGGSTSSFAQRCQE